MNVRELLVSYYQAAEFLTAICRFLEISKLLNRIYKCVLNPYFPYTGRIWPEWLQRLEYNIFIDTYVEFLHNLYCLSTEHNPFLSKPYV